MLTVLVVGFAFLAASFVARNADFWLHLATGRLLLQGRYALGTDPFGYTTAGVRWVNHAWLLDGIAFLLYRENADFWLVVLKAAMVAGLAGLMLRIRRPGASGWAPAFCTALAVLVMSPGLQLQPRCVSVALLGLTLWLLWRGRTSAGHARFLLIPLCALWVNLDDWFWLGPLLAGLFWVGDRLEPAERPTPWWLAPACLAACLCSPYHVFGFTPPADLYPLPFSGGLLHDRRFALLFASPWQFDAAGRSPAGANIAGLAYFLLFALGIASFAVNRAGLRDWRGVTWLVFALLGAWSVRLIPFFAVVAGPVAALNFQGMVRRPRPAVVKWLRAGCVAFLLALLALAAPGWLHGFNQRTMAVAWGVEINPSLRRAAETVGRWRRDGKLADGERSFCFHPDAACYLAYFGGGEKSFLDARSSLFSGVADDYVAVCRGLESAALPPNPHGADWRQILSDRGVAVVVLYVPEPASVLPVLGPLYDRPDEWTLLSVDGQAAIVGRKESARDDRFAGLRFDPGRLAFGGADDEAPAAPDRGPNRDPNEPGLLSGLGRPPVAPWQSAAAQADLLLFDAGWRDAVDRYYDALMGLVGLPADGPAPALARTAALEAPLEVPPDLALLAVRTGRNAVAAAPDDAHAYLQLGLAYLALRERTAEHARADGFSPLAMLRHVQAATALRQALVVNPDQEAAHDALANLFMQVKPVPFIDLAFEHRSAQLQLARRSGPAPGEKAEAYKARLDQMEARLRPLEKQVRDAQSVCAIRFTSIGDDPTTKANTALQLGLAATALDDVLMKARVEVYGSAVAQRELELLVLTGRAREALDMLDDAEMRANKVKLLTYDVSFIGDSPVAYTFPTYEWLLACAASAAGDYGKADAALEQIGDFLTARQKAGPPAYTASVAADVGAPAGGVAGPLALGWLGHRMMHTRDLYLLSDRNLRAERADVLTLRGLLDVEQGASADAVKPLSEAVALSRSVGANGGEAPGAALAETYWKRLAAGR